MKIKNDKNKVNAAKTSAPQTVDGWWAAKAQHEKMFLYGLVTMMKFAHDQGMALGAREEGGSVVVGPVHAENGQIVMDKLLSAPKSTVFPPAAPSKPYGGTVKDCTPADLELAAKLCKLSPAQRSDFQWN
jgi:hypothetical protein